MPEDIKIGQLVYWVDYGAERVYKGTCTGYYKGARGPCIHYKGSAGSFAAPTETFFTDYKEARKQLLVSSIEWAQKHISVHENKIGELGIDIKKHREEIRWLEEKIATRKRQLAKLN